MSLPMSVSRSSGTTVIRVLLVGAHHGVERRVRRTVAEGVEEPSLGFLPVRELVAWIAPPRGDHRKNEDPALAHQFLVRAWIARADRFGHMGEVEFDRPTTTGLEVDEHRPVPRAEQIARVRFAV